MFSIALRPTGAPFPPPESIESPGSELEDIRDLLMPACAALADADVVRFHLEGFGQVPWPVDVHTDPPVVLEQLPDLVGSLRESKIGCVGTIDFYEQGIERELRFDVRGDEVDVVHVACASRTKWKPDPSVERLPREMLLVMLTNLAGAFLETLGKLYPSLAPASPVLEAWRQAVVPADGAGTQAT